MDITKLLTFGIEYLSDYITIFLITLLKPSKVGQFIDRQQIEVATQPTIALPDNFASRVQRKINPKLFSFVIISIALASIVQSTVPNHSSSTELLNLIIIISIMWMVYASLIHILSRILGGQTDLILTLSVSLQIISVVYVVASLITLIWGVITQIYWVQNTISLISYKATIFVDDPILAYFFLQPILLWFYLPSGLLPVVALSYGYGLITKLFVLFFVIMTVGFSLFNAQFYRTTTILLSPGPTLIVIPTISTTATPSRIPTATPSRIPTATPFRTPTATPSHTPTIIPTDLATQTSIPATETIREALSTPLMTPSLSAPTLIPTRSLTDLPTGLQPLDLTRTVSNQLGPYQEHWFTFRDAIDDPIIFFMFEPNVNLNRDGQAQFFVYDQKTISNWPPNNADELVHIGAGSMPASDRDGDGGTGELIWGGSSLLKDTNYYIRFVNRSPNTIRYCITFRDLFDESCF